MRIAVLTGAGFSRNWGGFLAREFGEFLYSHPNLAREGGLRSVLGRTLDYENAFAQTIGTSSYEPFLSALDDCFALHDRIIKGSNEGYPCFAKLLRDLYRTAEGDFRFYTLNQDLMVERHDEDMELPLACPGIARASLVGNPPQLYTDAMAAVSESAFEIEKGRLPYLKLHGSCHWKTESGERVLITGKDKVSECHRFPVIRFMLEDFKDFCSNASILVIGYGFLDEHINTVLRQEGNRLIVIDPTELPRLVEKLRSIPGFVLERFVGSRTRPLREILGKKPKERPAILQDIFDLVTIPS